jgi:ZIP family zinc transporter
MLFWSVTFHNLPEGMAVGVLYAAAINDNSPQILGAAISLSIGIAIQNFPEGAIISMPLRGNGISKHKAFGLGVLSGIVEPIGAILTILAVSFILPILPILLGIAAGAMIFAILKELQPSIILNNGENIGTIFFAIGFSCMMALDVALG